MKQVVGTFFKDGNLLIDNPRMSPTFQIVAGSVEEIESFMCFGVDDDFNLLSNTLRNEIIPYCREKKLIYKR